jgi:hypothetical protein
VWECEAEVWECEAKVWKCELKCLALVPEAAEKPKINKLLAQWSTGRINRPKEYGLYGVTQHCNGY